MTGVVRYMNLKRGMVAVATEDGFTVLELLGEEVEVGDELAWRGLRPLGGETIRNVSRGRSLEVLFQGHRVAAVALRTALLDSV